MTRSLAWDVVGWVFGILVAVGVGVMSMTPPAFAIARVTFSLAALVVALKAGHAVLGVGGLPAQGALAFAAFGAIGAAWVIAWSWVGGREAEWPKPPKAPTPIAEANPIPVPSTAPATPSPTPSPSKRIQQHSEGPYSPNVVIEKLEVHPAESETSTTYQPPSSEVLRLTRVSLEHWRAQHPGVSVQVRVYNNDNRQVQAVVKTVEDILFAAGVPAVPGMRAGMSGGVPTGLLVVCALPMKGPANELRAALGNLCLGASLDVEEMPSNLLILHFNAGPRFTKDGRVVFD